MRYFDLQQYNDCWIALLGHMLNYSVIITVISLVSFNINAFDSSCDILDGPSKAVHKTDFIVSTIFCFLGGGDGAMVVAWGIAR